MNILEFSDNTAILRFVEDGSVPVTEPFRAWHFHLLRMAVEDVVVSFGRRTGPNVSPDITQIAAVFKITHDKFVVNASSETSRLEEFNRIEISNIHAALVWRQTFVVVLLNVKTEETDVDAFNLLESEENFRAELELFGDRVARRFSFFANSWTRFDAFVADENGPDEHVACFVVLIVCSDEAVDFGFDKLGQFSFGQIFGREKILLAPF